MGLYMYSIFDWWFIINTYFRGAIFPRGGGVVNVFGNNWAINGNGYNATF